MKQIAMLLVTFLILFDLSGCVLAAPQPALHADRPAVEGNRLTFSARLDGESENVTLLAALYCDGVLTGVKRNVQDGEFEIEAEKAYMLKFFAWEKDTMRPICDAVTFDGLGQGEEIQPYFTADSKIADVSADSAFGAYGRLLFPVNTGYFSGTTLGNLRLTWYNYIDPDKTVEIVNTLKTRAVRGETVFYDIYTDAEKAADSAKRNTGLFFFRGDPGAKFAICNAGGGFAYVGAMHDSFPHALELSKRGYNAFALIYRPGWDTAMEDLARAIAFVFEHADELQIDTADYSLWGGSAGARMAADLGSYGTVA